MPSIVTVSQCSTQCATHESTRGSHSTGVGTKACRGWCGRSSMSRVSWLGSGSCERLVAMGLCSDDAPLAMPATRPRRCRRYSASCDTLNRANSAAMGSPGTMASARAACMAGGGGGGSSVARACARDADAGPAVGSVSSRRVGSLGLSCGVCLCLAPPADGPAGATSTPPLGCSRAGTGCLMTSRKDATTGCIGRCGFACAGAFGTCTGCAHV